MTRKITFLMTSSLMFLVLVLASGVRPGAAARTGRMGASPAVPQGVQFCDPPITISEVRYLGKVQGADEVRVLWTASFGCLSAENQNFNVQVRVTRKFGHVDIKSVTHKVTGSQQNTLVLVPRGALETDPQQYEVTITGAVTAHVITNADPRIAILPEASGAGGKTFAVGQTPATCAVVTTITGIAYQGRTNGKDKVTVRINVASACLKPIGTSAFVTVVSRAAGQPERESSSNVVHPFGQIGNTGPFNATFSETVEVPVAPGTSADPIIHFKVTAKTEASATHTVSGGKSGNF